MKANGRVLIYAVLKGSLVFGITSKRIELQTWDWSSFEAIFEEYKK